jgi:hypothetical protein
MKHTSVLHSSTGVAKVKASFGAELGKDRDLQLLDILLGILPDTIQLLLQLAYRVVGHS